MFLSYIIILLLIAYFVYLIKKYSGIEKPEYNLQYFRDKEYIKYPVIIVGYLNNTSIKEEHFVATVLDFVCKGFVKVEQSHSKTDYIFTITKNIKATNIEMAALKIFFNNSFLSAFFLFIIAISFIKYSLLGRISWSTSIIATSFILTTLFYIYLDLTLWVFLFLTFMAIIILFDDMIQRKKTNIANACEMIKGLKKFIKDYSNIDEYDIYNIYLWDEYYVYAVALDIKKI